MANLSPVHHRKQSRDDPDVCGLSKREEAVYGSNKTIISDCWFRM